MKKFNNIIAFAIFAATTQSAIAFNDGYSEIKEKIFHRQDQYAVKMQKQIANSYENGLNGFIKDKAKAQLWYEAAFRHGDGFSGYKASLIAKETGRDDTFIKISEEATLLGNKNACLELTGYYVAQYKKDLFLNKKDLYKSRDVLFHCYDKNDAITSSKMKEIQKEISAIEGKGFLSSIFK